MTAPEPITPTPTTGKVMTWWGTGITIPTSGAPEPITPTPATGKVMTWRWECPTTTNKVSVGMLLAN